MDRINIFGNNITAENVIRNQLEIDEGDPYNEINVQSITDEHIKTVDEKVSLKEKEIMTI